MEVSDGKGGHFASSDSRTPSQQERSNQEGGLAHTSSSSGEQSNKEEAETSGRGVSLASAKPNKNQVACAKGEEFVIGYHSLGILDDNTDIPSFVKEHYTTLSFPEKLMLMLVHVERECAKKGVREENESVGWIQGGKAFVIRSKERFCKTWLPLFFVEAKYKSFTRKLYRWGFRKVVFDTQPANHSQQYFGNENFQRDNIKLLSRMRSVTAQKTREAILAQNKTQSFSQNSNAATSQSEQTTFLQISFAPNQQQPSNVNFPQVALNMTTDQLVFIQQALAQLQDNLGVVGQQSQQQNCNEQKLPSQNGSIEQQQQQRWEQQQQQQQQQGQPLLPQIIQQQQLPQLPQIAGQAASNQSSGSQVPIINAFNQLLSQLSQIASQQFQAQHQTASSSQFQPNLLPAVIQPQQDLLESDGNTQNTQSATIPAFLQQIPVPMPDQQDLRRNYIKAQPMETQSQSQVPAPEFPTQSQVFAQTSPRPQQGQEGNSQMNSAPSPSHATNVGSSSETSSNLQEQFRQIMETFLRQNQSCQPPAQAP